MSVKDPHAVGHAALPVRSAQGNRAEQDSFQPAHNEYTGDPHAAQNCIAKKLGHTLPETAVRRRTLFLAFQSIIARASATTPPSNPSMLDIAALVSTKLSFSPALPVSALRRTSSTFCSSSPVTSSEKYGSPLIFAATAAASFLLKSDDGRASDASGSCSCSPRKTIPGPRILAASSAATPVSASSPSFWPCAKYGLGPSSGSTSDVERRAIFPCLVPSGVDSNGFPDRNTIHRVDWCSTIACKNGSDVRSHARRLRGDPPKKLVGASAVLNRVIAL